jgi:uncharacterized protein (DUF1810 family)
MMQSFPEVDRCLARSAGRARQGSSEPADTSRSTCQPYRGLCAMTHTFDLQRFVDAQAPVFARVVDELRRAQKQSHWMWFIFPQVAGLGHSAMAQRFAISSSEEAIAYLSHPLLGDRLRECPALVNAVEDRSILDIFGSPDDRKFRSSMTLFKAVGSEPEFSMALERFFDGQPDRRTPGPVGSVDGAPPSLQGPPWQQ